jgi:hypothetical protein
MKRSEHHRRFVERRMKAKMAIEKGSGKIKHNSRGDFFEQAMLLMENDLPDYSRSLANVNILHTCRLSSRISSKIHQTILLVSFFLLRFSSSFKGGMGEEWR